MKSKIIFAGAMGMVLAVSSANADTILATEPFVRSAIDYATDYTDTVASTKQNLLPTTGATAGKVLQADGSGGFVWGDGLEALDLSTKADLQTGDTEDNVAVMDGSGQYVDSGVALTDLATVSSVNTALDSKANLQTGATANNVAMMNAGGQYIDSGVALSSLATTSSVNSALDDKEDTIIGGANAGRIMQATVTGYQWIQTTPDTFTP